jgi:mono/diheme cytochrome c family protein
MRVLLPIAASLALGAAAAWAESPADFEALFAAEARSADPAFGGFSPENGRRFFTDRHGGDWSCATCHGVDAAGAGEHAVTGKPIEALAPAANPARFTRPSKVAKWFQRNCNDVLNRPCTAREKGDVLAWLMTLSAKETR